jgi:hypothetical protein
MLRIIQTCAWDSSKSTPVEFIESMRNLIHLYETYDNRKMNERTQLAYILQALQRANFPIYAEDLKQAERDQHDLHWLTDRLTRTTTNLEMEKYGRVHTPSRQLDLHDPREDAEFVGFANVGRKRSHSLVAAEEQVMAVQCSLCHKTNHEAANCWAKEQCSECGEMGHIARACAIFHQRVKSRPNGKSTKPYKASVSFAEQV